MSESSQKLARSLNLKLAPLQTHWARLAPRERRSLALAAAVLGLYLLWAVGVAPAWRTLREAPAQRAALELQLQQMRALASEAQTLRAAPAIAPDQAQAALQAAAQRLGAAGQLTPQGPQRAVLALRGANAEQLMAFVGEARAGARARVVEAQLLPAGPGTWNGSLVLGLGASR